MSSAHLLGLSRFLRWTRPQALRDTGKQTYKEHLLASVCPWRLAALGIDHGWPPRGSTGEALVSAHPSEQPTEGLSDGQACRLPL